VCSRLHLVAFVAVPLDVALPLPAENHVWLVEDFPHWAVGAGR
jgi:hypothetical protein